MHYHVFSITSSTSLPVIFFLCPDLRVVCLLSLRWFFVSLFLLPLRLVHVLKAVMPLLIFLQMPDALGKIKSETPNFEIY